MQPSSPGTLNKKSPFQTRVENVLRMPFGGGNTARGVHHTIILLTKASLHDISTLDSDYSPIPMVMRYVYTHPNRRNIHFVQQLLDICVQRGLNINGSDYVCGHLERPLVLAASLAQSDWVKALLLAGANPGETDGRGRNAFYAAFDDRDFTKKWFVHPGSAITNDFWHDRREEYRQDCILHNRMEIVDSLFRSGTITDSLSLSRTNNTLLYVNSVTPCGTPLLAALLHQNEAEYIFLVARCHAVLTDMDYLILRQLNKLHCLKYAVTNILQHVRTDRDSKSKKLKTNYDAILTSNDFLDFECYSLDNHWSFPPTYHIAIQLTRHCGLPQHLFRQHLQPFLPRHWFYTDQHLNSDHTTEEIREHFQGYTF